MSFRLYDQSLVNKLKSWIKDDSLTITGPEETRRLFAYQADINDDKPLKLPLIALRRARDVDILSINKKPLTFDGATVTATGKKSIQLNSIPIALKYQLDIYTRYEAEAEEYVRNFLFNLINYPELTVEIPYNGLTRNANTSGEGAGLPFVHRSNIQVIPEIANNSDIPERLIPGQFTRYTISFTIDDAYLFSAPVRSNVSIECESGVVVQLQEKN